MTEKPKFLRFLLGGLIAGLISAALNNIYSVAHAGLTDFSIPDVIHFGSITGASIVPTTIGALCYFGLSRFTSKATLIFIIVASVFTLLSCFGPLQGELPDGSPAPDGWIGLTLPMHIIAGLVAVLFIPKYVYRK